MEAAGPPEGRMVSSALWGFPDLRLITCACSSRQAGRQQRQQ